MAFKSPPAKVHSYVTKLLKANLIKNPPVWYPAASLAPPSPTFLRERDPSGANPHAQLQFEKEAEIRNKKEALAAGQPAPASSTSTAQKELTRSSRSQKHLRWKTERPQKIVYPEDKLRRRFYEDHPWELRRPRCLIETSGDGTRRNWTSLLQPGRSIADLTGEE
jgi:small subunit ribosomal protein S23